MDLNPQTLILVCLLDLVRLHVTNQTMTDRGIPTLRVQGARQKSIDVEITEDELLLASPVVYGFSLSDKIWCKSRLPYRIAVSLILAHC